MGYLPTKRCQLYEEMIKLLLVTWNAAAYHRLDLDETEPQLAYVAYQMTKTGQAKITRDKLEQYIIAARKALPDILGYAYKLGMNRINRKMKDNNRSMYEKIYAKILELLKPDDQLTVFCAVWCVAWSGYNFADIYPEKYVLETANRLVDLWISGETQKRLRRQVALYANYATPVPKGQLGEILGGVRFP